MRLNDWLIKCVSRWPYIVSAAQSRAWPLLIHFRSLCCHPSSRDQIWDAASCCLDWDQQSQVNWNSGFLLCRKEENLQQAWRSASPACCLLFLGNPVSMCHWICKCCQDQVHQLTGALCRALAPFTSVWAHLTLLRHTEPLVQWLPFWADPSHDTVCLQLFSNFCVFAACSERDSFLRYVDTFPWAALAWSLLIYIKQLWIVVFLSLTFQSQASEGNRKPVPFLLTGVPGPCHCANAPGELRVSYGMQR